MKKILYIVIGAVVVLCGHACTDILDTTPTDKAAESTMWTTENLTDMGVMGIYSNLRNMCIGTKNGNSEDVGEYGFDSWGMTGQMVRANDLTNAIPATHAIFEKTWKKMYEGIHRANAAIANIPVKSPVSAEKKARLVAESKFLRAFFYMRLNALYKGVPYYDVPIAIEECIKSQETEEFIWGKVIEDLTACIDEPNLPNNDFKTERVTKGAAYALRGKAYLYMKKYAEAIADFAKVETCGYSLFQGGYKQLFTVNNERSTEMIFSIQNIAITGYGSKIQRFVGTNSAHGGGVAHGWNDFIATPDVADLYENADGTAFNWDNIIPGYNSLAPAKREVYFLRDIKKNGVEINPKVTNAVNDRLSALEKAYPGTKALYLEEGNEARIRKAYTNRDPRLEMNIVTPYSTFDGWANGPARAQTSTYRIPTAKGGSRDEGVLNDFWPNGGNLNGNNSYYFHRKFIVEGFNNVERDYCPTDEPLIRYADVLLMWAEALVELNQLTDAAAKVDMVRTRAGVEMPGIVYSNQNDLREKVRNERRIEFINEGINFFDEMRWGTLKDKKFYAGNGSKSVWGAVVGGSFSWPSKGDLNRWPVPAKEVEMNPNLVKTPGWQY